MTADAERGSGALHVGLVSTYPPRACGIGTFARDLREALLGTRGVSAVDVASIVRGGDGGQAPEVVARIHQDRRDDYPAAADALERAGVDVVMIEHEYGIFGGQDGAHVLALASRLRRPIVLTLHTVLSAPQAGQAETLRALCDLATLVCVFTETARRMVVEARLVSPERVRVVPHGGPPRLLPRSGSNGGCGRPLLATFGLISPGKGIETAIAGMPAIVARHPGARYLVAGRTHPEVAKVHGEEYRLSLQRLAGDLGVSDSVLFDDRFVDIDELASMLAATTIFLTPYRSREQIVSGALTFATVAGCPTVSTPFFYAEDLLGSGAGVLVPFDEPAALAGAVIELLDDPGRLAAMRARARAIGRRLAWPQVGNRTAVVLREAVRMRPRDAVAPRRSAGPPRGRFSHLRCLVDDVGIAQHAEGIVPVRASGYCTDDVARLAIVALGLTRRSGADADARMLVRSLAFLRHAWDRQEQAMHNFMSYDRRWLDRPHGGDHLGRATWALGEVVASAPVPALLAPTCGLLREMLPMVAEQRSPRTMAFATIGLAHAGAAVLGSDATGVLAMLAGRLADQRRANGSADWYWAEDSLAYDNARLPQALIAAGVRLGDDDLVREGLRSLEWYAGEVSIDGPHVRLVGHLGRRRGERGPGLGCEQPLDAAALAEAAVEAFAATEDAVHARDAVRAFEWFTGRNRLGRPVYDVSSGGCRDGLGAFVVNVNEGAESTLAYLQALLALDTAGLRGHHGPSVDTELVPWEAPA
jgi:glycosyltransferase involved in cell wall biosynthesis